MKYTYLHRLSIKKILLGAAVLWLNPVSAHAVQLDTKAAEPPAVTKPALNERIIVKYKTATVESQAAIMSRSSLEVSWISGRPRCCSAGCRAPKWTLSSPG